ncbi:LysR family transcriptional regulator [Rhizobium vallis]|uniref:LysR family transcriptional regulator n=1 Tax=Rhizobium vallis TaxID=634290 RepID=A0A3S0SN11_9HYPH|nr:LysR family transcriptional regulator [Rhizobium vallis]
MRYADNDTFLPLDLDLPRTFVALVESGSLSNAGPPVGRSQSAVSMQIQRLERSVGQELLVLGRRQDFELLLFRPPCGVAQAEPLLDYRPTVQSSTRRPSTRRNSPTLLVTRIRSRLLACAAISTS